ncbi:MAG TPA: hypothetical protein DHW02_04020 [Ktedonobacter sp.]|nr:hypothetical protein [Ktedonobacter sp.]
MSTQIVANKYTSGEVASKRSSPWWQTLLFVVVTLALFGLALWMRLHNLGLPFDRDSYDEGVYWQSLRSMSAGYTLYGQIFYSQPPFFLLSVYPTYLLFGQTIWAARLGIALVSLLGLLGAWMFGRAVAGRLGAIAALLLLVLDPLYLRQSQTLQAEAPSAALSFLAVGAAYLWWNHPDGIIGDCYAALAGAALSLSVLGKLLGVTAIIPVGLLLLAHFWRVYRSNRRRTETDTTRRMNIRSAIIGIVVCILVTAAFILPYAGSFSQFWHGVVTFHTTAGKFFASEQKGNSLIIQTSLTSFLTLAALYGTIAGLLRRNLLVVPILGWFVVTLYLLAVQVPLFPHHLVALTPPLVSLATFGIAPVYWQKRPFVLLSNILTVGAAVLVLLTGVVNVGLDQKYYHTEYAQSQDASTQKDIKVAQDIHNLIGPNDLIITDAQFVAALAGRSTPPQFVDTSGVRIAVRYLSTQELIAAASQPQVRAVMFYTHRLDTKNLAGFRQWVITHFRIAHRYGPGEELFVK